MGYGVEKTDEGFDWWIANSAYGAAAGTAKTLAEAKVEMYIAEMDVFETPLPPLVVEAMRSDYPKFGAQWPDPEVK